MNNSILEIIKHFVYQIPQLFMLGICIYFIARKVNLASIFMLAGSLGGTIVAIARAFTIYRITAGSDVNWNAYGIIQIILSVLGILSYIMYAVGILVLVNSYLGADQEKSY